MTEKEGKKMKTKKVKLTPPQSSPLKRGGGKRLNAVIGYPLSHSRSPKLHNPVYELLKLNAVLSPISNPDVKALVAEIRSLPLHLTAVTMPHKQSIMPLLDSVDAAAKKVGAVNTVINKKGKLHGYNTDVAGIEYALRDTKLKDRNVLLVGAGGAANAVAYVIKQKKGNLLYLNRTEKHAEELQKRFGGIVLSFEDTTTPPRRLGTPPQLRRGGTGRLSPQGIDVIINATPVGMYPKIDDVPIPEELLDKHQAVFDLVYNPVDTKLLKLARKKGAKIISGLDMFAVQGLRQIELWTGKKIITKSLVEKVKNNLLKTL
ncbi:MAG: shikimate dehydrogenase [Candidatus Taylorbacteria bacterium]|nr:shikimate dehydrogenase [Candidatus Taylorbacteria bacterium]